MRRILPGILLAGVALVLACLVGAQELRARGGGDAARALAASVEVERILKSEEVRRYDDLKEARRRSQAALATLYNSLDTAVDRAGNGTEAELQEVIEQVEELEAQRARTILEQREVLQRLVERMTRIRLLEARLASMREQVQAEAGVLTGTWDVVLLPSGQRGSFALEQSGTVVSGTYRLDGGWTGSLQGTLVSRKVYLVRIDSRLGRSMEFEGILAADGNTIRGTWLNYDLAAEGGSQGQWSATRPGGGR